MGNYTLNDLDYAYYSTGKARKALNDLRTKADLDIALSAARSIYPSDSINDALYKYYSVTVDAVNVLKKYGTDAHIYLPGASYPINGIQAGNYLDSAGTTAATVDNPVGLVVDPFGAINATQATTANKPILRLNSGKYSWQFDGVNDSLSLSAPLFQMSDDHAVIAGASIASFATWNGVFINGATVADFSPGIWVQGTAPGKVRVEWASTVIDSASAVTLNQPFVVSALARGVSVYGRINTIQFGTTSKPGGSNATVASIGSLNGATDFCNGRIYPVIAIKGTVTDSDLLTLERFVGQLSGVTI